MVPKKRQLTIKGAYRRKAQQVVPDEECDELEREIAEIQRQLALKKQELFEAERLTLRSTRPAAPCPVKVDAEPMSVMYESKKRDLERQLEMMAMVTGAEVAEYAPGERCCVLFHAQHDAARPLRHGMRIDMSTGNNVVSKFSLPLGFNFEAVMSEHDNIMHPACLGAFHRSLVAYYDRQMQYDSLRQLVKYEVQLHRLPDSSHVELRLTLRRLGAAAQAPPLPVALQLDYRVYDTRAKQTTLNADMSEEEMRELSKQCSVFKKKPMAAAFKECFMEGRGPWECCTYQDEILPSLAEQNVPKQKDTARRPAAPGSDDETWLPDDD